MVFGDRNLEYLTHRELDGALELFPDWARADWVATDARAASELDHVDGLWVVPGSPYRDDRAVSAAIERAREPQIGASVAGCLPALIHAFLLAAREHAASAG